MKEREEMGTEKEETREHLVRRREGHSLSNEFQFVSLFLYIRKTTVNSL